MSVERIQPEEPSTPRPRPDGRTARRERGRAAVIEAVVDLLVEGHSPPPTTLVTRRAGISEATLFRYFETLADLQIEATTTYLNRRAHLFEIPDLGAGPLPTRVRNLVRARTTLWETTSPIARLGRARAFDQPELALVLHQLRLSQAAQLRDHFAPELAQMSPARGEDVVAAVASLTSFEAWDHQHHDLGRTMAQVRRSWRLAITALWTSVP